MVDLQLFNSLSYSLSLQLVKEGELNSSQSVALASPYSLPLPPLPLPPSFPPSLPPFPEPPKIMHMKVMEVMRPHSQQLTTDKTIHLSTDELMKPLWKNFASRTWSLSLFSLFIFKIVNFISLLHVHRYFSVGEVFSVQTPRGKWGCGLPCHMTSHDLTFRKAVLQGSEDGAEFNGRWPSRS